MISAKRCIKTLREHFAKVLRPSNPSLTIVNHINFEDDDWLHPFYASFNKTIAKEERIMSKLQLEVGKKYDTRDGRIVEIVFHNKNCSSPAEEFVGLVPSGSQPDKTMPRTYYADGRSSGSVSHGIANRDLIREHSKEPPFELKVGQVYPTRDGKGFGFVFHVVNKFALAMVFYVGFKTTERVYGINGSVADSHNNRPDDLVPGPFRDQQAHMRAMAAREAMNLALDIASGKRGVREFGVEYMHPAILRSESYEWQTGKKHEWQGEGFTLSVHHLGANS